MHDPVSDTELDEFEDDDIAYFDEELDALGGNPVTLTCQECGLLFDVFMEIAQEMWYWQAEAGDPICCPMCCGSEEGP